MHGDEASYILQARELQAGARPLGGANEYTGALYPYSVWPFLQFFGYRIEVLRTVSAVLNTTALLFIAALLRQHHPHSPIWLWTAFLVCISPTFVVLSRFALEQTVLGPLLIAGGLWAIASACRVTGLARAGLSLIGGAAWGLASYNHILATTVPVALSAAFLLTFPSRLLRHPVFWLSICGFLAGFTPRLVLLSSDGSPGSSAVVGQLQTATSQPVLADFLNLPSIFFGVLNGSLLYQRVTGENMLHVVPYFSLALGATVFLRVIAGCSWRLRKLDVALLLSFFFMLVLTNVVSPRLALRYLLLPALCAPYILVRLAMPIFTTCYRRLAMALLLIVAVANILYLTTNYFVDFSRTGGKVSVFPLGSRLAETSNHFISVRRLYEELVNNGVELVYSEALLVWPLEVLDYDARRLRFAILPPDHRPTDDPGILRLTTALVYYNGPVSVAGGASVIDVGDRESIRSGPIVYRRSGKYDDHFAVFTATGR